VLKTERNRDAEMVTPPAEQLVKVACPVLRFTPSDPPPGHETVEVADPPFSVVDADADEGSSPARSVNASMRSGMIV
jgi:hypothetical protein